MFCTKCGAENPEGARFCAKCGAPLQAGVPAPAAAAPLVAPIAAAEYAGFWRRLLAYIIDGFILGAAGWVLFVIAGSVFLVFGPAEVAICVLTWPLGWLYFALMESSKYQGTLGKMALGIIVTDMEGRRISFGRATGRYFAKIISAIIIYIGFLMIAFTERKQGLHDMIADCLVVMKN